MKTLEEVRQSLEKRGYEAKLCTVAEAVEAVKKAVSAVGNVGFGGCQTLKDLGLREWLEKSGVEIRDHRPDCELFILSANALLEDGRIVNIDGTGNRIAASIYGPSHVLYLIGRNKIVAGGIDAAIERVKSQACPPNARRLNRRTPCGIGGRCTDCSSPDRMCKVTAIFDAPPSHTPTTVLLIDAELGY